MTNQKTIKFRIKGTQISGLVQSLAEMFYCMLPITRQSQKKLYWEASVGKYGSEPSFYAGKHPKLE